MTAARPSYPYLDMAKRIGADYGLVLSYADALDRIANEVPCRLTYWEQKAVEFVDNGPHPGMGPAVRIARAVELDAQARVQAIERARKAAL